MGKKKITKRVEGRSGPAKVNSQKSKAKNILKNPLVKIGLVVFSVWQIIIVAVLLILVSIFIYTNYIKNENQTMHYYKFKKEGELTFTDSTGNPTVKIDIEIADNDYERQLGLMNRQSMEEMQGMLFIFPKEEFQSFWMRNTLFALDILFINSQKEIVTIHKNTKPLSEQSYPSSEPAIYVLEVNAGFCERHNVNLGNKVFWIGSKLSITQ